ARTHVTMRELEPRSGERIGKLLRMLEEATRDFLVSRIEAQRKIRSQHGRHELAGLVEGVRDRCARCLGNPLMSAGGALGELPLEAEQILEKVVAPLRRGRGPGDFQSAGDGIGAGAGAELVAPAEAQSLQIAGFRFDADVTGGSSTVRL